VLRVRNAGSKLVGLGNLTGCGQWWWWVTNESAFHPGLYKRRLKIYVEMSVAEAAKDQVADFDFDRGLARSLRDLGVDSGLPLRLTWGSGLGRTEQSCGVELIHRDKRQRGSGTTHACPRGRICATDRRCAGRFLLALRVKAEVDNMHRSCNRTTSSSGKEGFGKGLA
jgi:hypothetical protein